jgi:hypothetical protein
VEYSVGARNSGWIIEVGNGGLPADLDQSIRNIEHSVKWMDVLLTPRFFSGSVEKNAERYREHIRMPGHSFVAEDSTYHHSLIEAFSIAVDGDTVTGDQLARSAESTIFDHIIAPYNRMFGENKKPRLPTGYVKQAVEAFDSLLGRHSRFTLVDDNIAEPQKWLAREVFRRAVVSINNAADASRRRWKTTSAFWLQRAQFTWLPVNYGLRPDQYDTQPEWDTVVARLTGQTFTDCNTVEYLVNEQFHPHLKKMIHETEKYQVLVIHDFTGRGADNDTDPIGWDMVVDGYMKALINAVKAVDRGEREQLPQYLLFIDQNFYTVNKSYQIITYVENLYTSDTVKLKDKDVQQRVETAHRELIETIQTSPTFQHMGEETLRGLFKVNVSVTNSWDPTFAIDVTMRDHRKFAFRDVTEHYQPPTWEDRGMVIRGAALVKLKRAARYLCVSQDFEDDEMPTYLRDRPFPADYEKRCEELKAMGWTAPVLIAMNDTGYGRKLATVLRAAIYNLAPKGSVLVAIDSLWLSDFWAGMFVCAALRGAHVYAVAPSPLNAPSAANFTMFLARENLELMLEARQFFADDLRSLNGRIHVGLYSHDYGVDDASGRGQALIHGLDNHPFITEDFPVSPSVIATMHDLVDREVKKAQSDVGDGADEDDWVEPFLHMKTQFFGTRLGMQIMSEEEWGPIVDKYVEIRLKQAVGEITEGLTPHALTRVDAKTQRATVVADFLAYLETLPPDQREKVIYAFTIGSMNQDRRGMISDGEILACIAGYSGLIGVLDMILILGTSRWPADASHFDELFPPPNLRTGFGRLSRYLQDLF